MLTHSQRQLVRSRQVSYIAYTNSPIERSLSGSWKIILICVVFEVFF